MNARHPRHTPPPRPRRSLLGRALAAYMLIAAMLFIVGLGLLFTGNTDVYRPVSLVFIAWCALGVIGSVSVLACVLSRMSR